MCVTMKMALIVDEKRRNCCIKRNFGALGKSAKVSSSERERWRYRGCGGHCGRTAPGKGEESLPRISGKPRDMRTGYSERIFDRKRSTDMGAWGIKAWESDEGQDVIHILENEYIPEHPVMELGEIIRLPL